MVHDHPVNGEGLLGELVAAGELVGAERLKVIILPRGTFTQLLLGVTVRGNSCLIRNKNH